MQTRTHTKTDPARKRRTEKERQIKRQIFVKWGEENERKMANNVNCKEMRFVIRNLVMLKILPGNGARNSF